MAGSLLWGKCVSQGELVPCSAANTRRTSASLLSTSRPNSAAAPPSSHCSGTHSAQAPSAVAPIAGVDLLGPPAVNAAFARVPAAVEQGGHNMLQMRVTEREEYIAKTGGSRTFPWRVCVVANNDASLAASDMVYRLAAPPRLADTS